MEADGVVGQPGRSVRRVSSLPVMVPTTRLVLRMGSVARTGFRSSSAGFASSSNVVESRVLSNP